MSSRAVTNSAELASCVVGELYAAEVTAIPNSPALQLNAYASSVQR
jgi:hypothetical protein